MGTCIRVVAAAVMLLMGSVTNLAAQTGPAYNGQDLTQADFAGQDLQGASFNDAHLMKADFSGAQLQAATLDGADLRLANFAGADLSQATLSGARLGEADLRGAVLESTNFTGADLTATHLEGADLTRAVGLTADQLSVAITDDATQLPAPETPTTNLAPPQTVSEGASGPVGLLPAGFPLPPGTSLVSSAGDPSNLNVVLAVPDAGGASSFWRNTLPVAGYAITPSPDGQFTLLLSGNGYRQGRIAIAQLFGPSTTATISLQR